MFKTVKDFAQIEEDLARDLNSPNVSSDQRKFLKKFKANPIEILRTNIPINILKSFPKGLNENTQIIRLAELQGKYGYDSATTGVITADGNTAYEDVNYSFMTGFVDAVNSVSNIRDLWTKNEYSHMAYLNPNINTFTKNLRILNEIFDMHTGAKKPGKSLQLMNVNGTSQITEDENGNSNTEGTITAKLDPIGKGLQELHSMLGGGVSEFNRMSEKKNAYGLKVVGGIVGKTDPISYATKGVDTDLYVDVIQFANNGNGEIYAINNHFLGYIQSEFDRIVKFKGNNREEYLNFTGFNNKVNDVNGVEKYAGEIFNDFDDILSKDTQNKLYALADEYATNGKVNIPLAQYLKSDAVLLKDIQTDITNYFKTITQNYKELYFDKLPYISKSILVKAGVPKEKLLTRKQVEEAQEDPKNIEIVLKAFMYNDWIHRFEVSSLMFGDRAQWNHGKEEQPKRIPGAQSDGVGFVFDKFSRDFINNVFNKTTETYGAKLTRESEDGTKYDSFQYSDVLNTAVIKDAQRESIYLAEYQAAWKKDYIDINKYSEEEADRLVALDSKPFTKDKMEESDGIAYMTLDAYRTLHKTGRGWSIAQEELYQKVVAGEKITNAKEFFPIYKLHYYGSLKNDLLPAMAMHKFSVAPLIPGVYPENSELGKLHKKMLKDNVQYVTFKSGSKAVTLTNGGSVDNLFANSNENSINEDFAFTVNPIFMANLKEVTVINEYYKKTLPIATQTRVIILDNLYNDGKLTNPDNAEIVNSYTDAVRDYSIVLKDELLNKIGYSLNEDGNYEGNITTFVQLLREELGNRDIPEQLLKLLNTTKEGKLSIDLSLHPQAETIEKLLLSIIQTTLIKQQTNGEPLTQMPSTFTNGIWDDQYKTLTDPAEIKRLLGTNTLPFYNINPITGKINLMKVAIALQGEYKNLLKAKDLDGNVIGTIDRLNELIKDDKWLEQNRDAISLFGPRIPNDATNTIEGAEVWHFFDESFGNVIILPTEIVAKAGSDYDGDKLFMSMPNIDNDGNYINKGIDNYDALLKETIALEKDGKLGKDRLKSGQLIEIQKKYLQNLYLKKSIDLLTLPDNFGYLTKANQTYLVEKYAEDLQRLGTGYNRYKSATHAEPKKSTGPKNKQKDVVSPTRQNEISHQLYLHDANLSLEPSLGVQANFTKSHVLYKTVGVNMPASYTTSYANTKTNKIIKSLVDLPMVMRLKHNTAINEAGKEVISLSGEKTQLDTRITDINSHALNGILDRAKNSFPFDLKLVPEAINTLNYMLQAGVSEEEIFYFLTQPLIVEYIKDQKLRKSPYYTIVYGESKGSKATESANAIIQNMINVKEVDVAPYFDQINLLKLKATLDSYAVKKNKELYNVILLDKTIRKDLTVEYIIDQINKGNIDPKTILKISNNKGTIFTRLNDSKYLFTDENYAFTTQAFSDKLLPAGSINIDFLKKHIKDSSSPAALALFFNYLELEEQYEGMSELQKVFSPDTSKLTTTQQVVKREDAYANLYENSKVDSASLDRLRKNSVLASFNQDKLILDLVTPLFPLRLSNQISSYINKLFTSPTENRRITNKFGAGVDGQEFFTKKYQNAIVAYIYQNYMSRFVNADGTLTNIPEYYNDKLTIIDNTIDTNVIVDKYSIIVNSDRIKNEYQKKAYLSTNETEIYIGDVFTKDPFNTLNSYYRYTIEKELLRTQIPIESLEQNKDFLNLLDTYSTADAAYESYISEKALANTYNRSYIIGTSKYSYTEKVLNIIKEFADTNLKDKYPILAQLAPVNTKKAVKLIQLNDKQIAKGTLGEIYINNLINLANPIIKKVDDPIDNQRISDAFKDFSLMMFYQHGVGSSKLGFVNAIDPESYMENITKFSQDFLNNYLKGNENFSGQMTFAYDKNKRSDVKSTTTFDAILAGERTATTRYSDNKAFNYWKEAKVGDIITWDSGDGRTVDVVVTKALAPLVGSGKTAEQWSKLEGWSVDYFNKQVKSKLNTAWQLEYELYKNPLTDVYNMLMAPSNLFGNFEIKDTEDEKSLSKADSLPPLVMPGSKPTSVTPTNKKVIKNEKGLIIINDAIPAEKTIDIVKNNKDFIQETSFKQTGGSVSWGYGMQWIRSSALTDKQKQGVQVGKQIGGQEVTEEMVNQLLAGTETKKIKGLPLYVYTTIDINGNRLPNIPNEIIEILLEQGIDVSQYDASYNSVYDKGDKGSLIVHQDNTEFNTSPIITVSLGRPMKFITYQLKDSNNYSFGTNAKNKYELTLNTISNKLVAGKLAPELKRQKNFRGDEVIGYGELTPGNLAKYAKMVGEESAALDVLANSIEKIEEHTLTNGAVLVFSKENRNVFHEIIFDEETDALSMPKGFPELTINKAYKGLGKPDQMVKTKDYRVVLTLRKVNGTKELNVVDTNKLTASQPTQTPTISVKNFDKKNLFTVTPIQSADKKAVIKASIATQYIGFGEGIKGSSTESYRQEVGALANTGNYSADDVIFVSIGGKRGTAEQEKTQQDRTIKEAIKAVEAGATILTDNKAYTNASSYNTGEKRLYANMEAKGYNYSEVTIDGQVIGTWSKTTQPVTSDQIDFQEEPTSGYKNRTIKNASADATIALAYDFNSAGEKLTKSSVLNQNKKYISLNIPKKTETSDISKADIRTQIKIVVDQLNSVNATTLNIAGNGIYTMRNAGWNQEEVDLITYRLLKGVVESPNLKNKIVSIRSGGQTGFDEAGAKAGIKLGLPTIVLAPKGWTFRNESGTDISNEQAFKARFTSTQPSTSVKGINISTKSSDKLGRELTNPNWGAKNIMDIEAEYKANASKLKAPNLNAEEALRYDMNLMYKLQMKKFKAHPELIKEITDRGGVAFLNASEHNVGVKGSRWEGKGNNSNFIKVLIKSYEDSLKNTQPSANVQTIITKGSIVYSNYGLYDGEFEVVKLGEGTITKRGKNIDRVYKKDVIVLKDKNDKLIKIFGINKDGVFYGENDSTGKSYSSATTVQFNLLQPTQSSTKIEVKAFRTSGTFSSTVDYAQRGSGTYYALDKPFQELGRTDKVEEVKVSYNPSKTLDATTEEGQSKFMEIKRKAVEGKTFDEVKDLNDAVSQEMMNNGYESLIGWIDEDVPNVGRELVIYPTQPLGIKPNLSFSLFDKLSYTKNLFKGISDNFSNAIQRINNTKSLEEFQQLYNELVKENNWDNLKNNESSKILKDFYTDVFNQLSKVLPKTKSTTQPIVRKTYSGKVTNLESNQIFVFGSNPLGINGNPSKGTGGAALVAYRIAGVKQGEKMDNRLSDSGKAWGITTVTGPGKKKSKTPQEITEGVKKLYDYAKENPTKEFLISDYSGTNLNGYTGQEMADMFSAAGPIPSNIIFNENFNNLITDQSTIQPVGEVKEGVSELFKSNPELANIGTQEQYSQYLDSIYPDSKVKDIVYHGTTNMFDEFDIERGTIRGRNYGKGVYLTPSIDFAKKYAIQKGSRIIFAVINAKNPFVTSIMYQDYHQISGLNKDDNYSDLIENDSILSYERIDRDYTRKKNNKFIEYTGPRDKNGLPIYELSENITQNPKLSEIVVKPEQIHQLGNKQDIERFKEFVSTQLSVQPKVNLVKIINDEDVAKFNSYLAKSNNKLPLEFFTTASTFKEFYNPASGKREKAPHSTKWVLNENNFYDLVDKDGGEIYIENVDLTTGLQHIIETDIESDQRVFNQIVKQNNGQYPKRFENQGRVWLLNANNTYDSIDEVSKSVIIKNMNMVTGQIEPEITTSTPVNQKELFNFIQSINSAILTNGLDVTLANNGIDVQDVLDEADKVTTQEELTDLENKVKKYICR
jgi:alkylated DNA repair dioxygenase AlkB